MTILIAGASGATGKLLAAELLNRGHKVKAIVRSPEKFPENLRYHDSLYLIEASILELSDGEFMQHVKDCDAVASCLGHNMSLKGLFGHPRKLVKDATAKLCNAIKANNQEYPIKYVLMNTTGNSNRDIDEKISFAQGLVIGILRGILPPHVDNEAAADYLRTSVGQNDKQIEWAVVRPDSLIDDENVTPYDEHPSPTRSALFDPGKTSRINVAHFMAELIDDDDKWKLWKGKMPVIYNRENGA